MKYSPFAYKGNSSIHVNK